MKWFRFYDDALDDPKVQLLSGDLFKSWVNLLSLASKNDGKLPPVNDIAFRLRISVQDAQQRVDELIFAQLIDILPDKTLVPHNWAERQFQSDSSALRMQKLRVKNRNKNKQKITCDVTCDNSVKKSYGTESYSYTDSDKEPLGLSSSLDSAREAKDLKGFRYAFAKTDDRKKERLHRRAEGLGLDVDDLINACNVHKAKNKPAYFTSLCVQRLQLKVKGLSEEAIRAALWDKSEGPYTTVMQAILVAS